MKAPAWLENIAANGLKLEKLSKQNTELNHPARVRSLMTRCGLEIDIDHGIVRDGILWGVYDTGLMAVCRARDLVAVVQVLVGGDNWNTGKVQG